MQQSPFMVGVRHPLNLMMLGLVIFATLMSAWWLLPLGLLLWLIMVLRVARSPALKMNMKMQSRAPLSPRFQQVFDRVQRSQVRIFNTLSGVSSDARKAWKPVQDAIESLTERVYSLCLRMTTLDNFQRVSQSRAEIETELRHINDAMPLLTDEMIREQYKESQQSLQERLDKLKTTSKQLERADAELMSVVSELESVMAMVMSSQAMPPGEIAGMVPGLVARIDEQSRQVQAFEKEAAQFRT